MKEDERPFRLVECRVSFAYFVFARNGRKVGWITARSCLLRKVVEMVYGMHACFDRGPHLRQQGLRERNIKHTSKHTRVVKQTRTGTNRNPILQNSSCTPQSDWSRLAFRPAVFVFKPPRKHATEPRDRTESGALPLSLNTWA